MTGRGVTEVDPPYLYPDYRSTVAASALARAAAAARGAPRARRTRLRRGRGRPGRRGSHDRARRRTARRADHRHRARPRRRRPAGAERAARDLAGERRRPLSPRGRPASGPARSELHRRRADDHRRRGPLPLRHGEARRLSVEEPPERLAAGAHPLLRLRPRLHAAARHPDVLPGRSAVRRTTRSSTPSATRRPASCSIARFDLETTQPEWALGFQWDIILRSTPFEE